MANISKMSLTQLADLFGEIDTQEKILSEFKARIRNQLVTRTSAEHVYGDNYTVFLLKKTRRSLDKKAFISRYGQRIYDLLQKESDPFIITKVVPVVTQEKAKDVNILSRNFEGLGIVSAKAV